MFTWSCWNYEGGWCEGKIIMDHEPKKIPFTYRPSPEALKQFKDTSPEAKLNWLEEANTGSIPANWNPPAPAGGGMRNSREVAFLKGATGSCRWGLHFYNLRSSVFICGWQGLSLSLCPPCLCGEEIFTLSWRRTSRRISRPAAELRRSPGRPAESAR